MKGFFNRNKKTRTKDSGRSFSLVIIIIVFLLVLAGTIILFFEDLFPQQYIQISGDMLKDMKEETATATPVLAPLDTVAYDEKLEQNANYASTTSTTTLRLWPVKTVYPNPGALLPFNRIIAYYGNLYSTQMGVLGEYPKDEMFAKLQTEVKKWEDADPETPVIPALHYIVETAQGSPGADGTYRFQMPDSEIDKIIEMADEIHAIVFLDFQVALSTLQKDLPDYEKYFKMPQVHLGIDPEFSMKTGAKPGTVIGTLDATDINYAANFLAKIVQDNNLPPKIFVIHRFTGPMVTNYKKIEPLPEVQIVMNMDGWGSKTRKIGTYNAYIYNQPVQFTGFKLFYKNDVHPPTNHSITTTMMTPEEVLKLKPQPLYIQYQ